MSRAELSNVSLIAMWLDRRKVFENVAGMYAAIAVVGQPLANMTIIPAMIKGNARTALRELPGKVFLQDTFDGEFWSGTFGLSWET